MRTELSYFCAGGTTYRIPTGIMDILMPHVEKRVAAAERGETAALKRAVEILLQYRKNATLPNRTKCRENIPKKRVAFECGAVRITGPHLPMHRIYEEIEEICADVEMAVAMRSERQTALEPLGGMRIEQDQFTFIDTALRHIGQAYGDPWGLIRILRMALASASKRPRKINNGGRHDDETHRWLAFTIERLQELLGISKHMAIELLYACARVYGYTLAPPTKRTKDLQQSGLDEERFTKAMYYSLSRLAS